MTSEGGILGKVWFSRKPRQILWGRAHTQTSYILIVDKHPLAVLEINDGLNDAPVHRHHDESKDSIMEKAGIPLRRPRTNAYKPDEWLEGVV